MNSRGSINCNSWFESENHESRALV